MSGGMAKNKKNVKKNSSLFTDIMTHTLIMKKQQYRLLYGGKFGLGIHNEAGQRLIEFCQENALVITNTLLQQHKRRLYTWTSPDDQHRNQIDYILCSQRWRSSIQSNKQDQELTVAQIMNSLLPNSV